MPRQPRIQFEGAVYHVMARGNRRGKIFSDAEDHRTFLRTLGETCERSGFLAYAWVLMGNHYHLALSTPRGNLVEGMTWLQNTYTRRFNVRNRQWGRLFGDRYKSILVERDAEGPYLPTLLDYIHLNPARARIVSATREESLLDYQWSSLSQVYAKPPSKRPKWMAWDDGFSLMEAKDTAAGRRGLIERLDSRMAEEQAAKLGLVEIEGQSLQSTLRRGWYWGTEAFKERMLAIAKSGTDTDQDVNRDYRSSPLGKASTEEIANDWLRKGFEHFGIDGEAQLQGLPRAHRTRVAIAWALWRRTSVSQRWIAEKVGYRTAANVSQQVRRFDQAGEQQGQSDVEQRWQDIVNN